MSTYVARPTLVVCVLMLVPRLMAAPPVHPRFELTSPDTGPFPSNMFTVPEAANLTGLRVDLPMADCAAHPSDCEDIAVINTLDGFNVQPRLSIPFDGAIDVHSVTSDTLFLVELVCANDEERCDEGSSPRRIGIDQVVWDTLTHTLHVESDELLDQHTRYALIVTRGVRDAFGAPVAAAPAFARFRQTVGGAYKQALLDALRAAREVGVRSDRIAVASVFTTQSVTAVMEKIRGQIRNGPAGLTDFALGAGEVRTVFPLGEVTSVSWTQHTRTAPSFNTVAFPLPISVPCLERWDISPSDVSRPAITCCSQGMSSPQSARGPAHRRSSGRMTSTSTSCSLRARRRRTAGRWPSSEPWAAGARKA